MPAGSPSSDSARARIRIQQLSVCVLIVALVALAFTRRFVQDDAFISFRYARNLVEGHGLVFNQGERVEGYSNFLWVIIMAIPMALGWDPVWFSQIAGLLALVGTLYFCYRLARRVLGSFESAILFLAILGTHFTFSAFATGGLETSLHTFLLVWGAYLAARLAEDQEASARQAWLFSVVCAAAILTRLDSVIFVAGYAAYLLYTRRKVWPKSRFLQAAWPLLVILGTWFAWKLYYYGTLIPNTFWVKAASDRSMALGWQYLWLFVKSYWLYLALLPALIHPLQTFWKSPLSRLFSMLCVLWILYVAFLGGDFMEFRILVAIVPFLTLLAMLGVEKLAWRPTRYALAGALVGISFVHGARFQGTVDVESVPRLAGNVAGKGGWAEVGRVLGQLFDHAGCDVRIATTPAGAIPYYSGLHTLDMLGLNDAWVAQHGVRFSSRPGHQRLAPHAYLMEQNAHLVLGQPQIESRRVTRQLEYRYPDLARFFLIEMYPERIPAEACVLEIPLNDEFKLEALYLTPSPCIDSTIARLGWNRFPIVRER